MATNINIKSFFTEKTIQRSDKFYVTILPPNPPIDAINREYYEKLNTYTGPMPDIKNWHVNDVSIPSYDFQKESVFGDGPLPKSFPVLKHDSFDVKITLEEDSYGTIRDFITWCQRRIIDGNGLYWNQSLNRIPKIMIFLVDETNVEVAAFVFSNCYFVNSEALNLSYGETNQIKYTLTFVSDLVEYYKNESRINDLKKYPNNNNT